MNKGFDKTYCRCHIGISTKVAIIFKLVSSKFTTNFLKIFYTFISYQLLFKTNLLRAGKKTFINVRLEFE